MKVGDWGMRKRDGEISESEPKDRTITPTHPPVSQRIPSSPSVSTHLHWYLPEDYAFCERARQSGFKILADTTIRLWHHGSYGYSWEDAGKNQERYEPFYFNVE